LTAGDALEGRTVVVTGAAQGIGREFAAAFGTVGATVVVADLDGDRAAETAEELVGAGVTSSAVEVDVTDEESVRQLVAATVGAHGTLDVLVNNAAIFSTITMKPFDEIDLAEWNAVMAVNLTGAFLCCKAVAPQMRRQQRGRIINISSATVLMGRPNYLHYVTSKAGIVGLTRALARELGGDGVTVNAIMPGSVDTGIPRDSATPEAAAAIVARQAVPTRLTPGDITGAALFLASDGASALTGQTIVVDGGMNFL